MRRNSGIIGTKIDTSTSNASGVHDTFDVFNRKKLSKWPVVSPSCRITLNATTFNEGQTLYATIYTSGIDIGATINWSIDFVSGNALTATDFSALSGSFTVDSNYYTTVSIPISNDLYTEGTEVFSITVKYNGNTMATSSNFTVYDTSTGTPEPQELYTFTSFTFTNAGITGRYGPTLSNCLASYNTSTYSWLTNTNYFNVVTQGYQLWTVPATGNYQITAIGAAGGIGYGSAGSAGRGASMVSTYSLTKGDKLNIIVGQQGGGLGTNSCGGDGAGGGGSFVFTSGGTCLLAAGGGGGGAQNVYNTDPTVRDAPNSTSGNKGSGSLGGAGGTSGNGGSSGTGCIGNGGGGGAGVSGNGSLGSSSSVAVSYASGFIGGSGGFAGGFGGGGGNGNNYTAGGGGGYSGGGGGGLDTCACNAMGTGGGGGCYSSTSYTYTANIGTGQGSVTITKL